MNRRFFIKRFPNIFKPENKHFLQTDDHPFKLEAKCDFPSQLKKYAEHLKVFIRKELMPEKNVSTPLSKKSGKLSASEKEKRAEAQREANKKENDPPLLEAYFEETVNYLYRRIYHKLFPPDPNDPDLKIYVVCRNLKEKNYEKSKYEDVDKFIPEMVEALMEFESQTCPNGKAEAILKCFSSCNWINVYVRGKTDPGMDEFLPMFTYALIQQTPMRMSSNIEFLKLYLDDKKFQNVSFQVSIVEAACEFLINFDLSTVK